MGRRALALGIAALGLAVGTFSLAVARNEPGYSVCWPIDVRGLGSSRPAGPSSAADSRSVWRPVAASGRCSPRRASRGSCPSGTTRRSTPRLPSRSAYACTRHALRSSPCGAAYPSGRLGSHTERGVASLTWAACSSSASCPPLCTTGRREDAISVRATLNDLDREALSTELNRVGVYLGVAWALGLTALALVKLARASGARASRPALAT